MATIDYNSIKPDVTGTVNSILQSTTFPSQNLLNGSQTVTKNATSEQVKTISFGSIESGVTYTITFDNLETDVPSTQKLRIAFYNSDLTKSYGYVDFLPTLRKVSIKATASVDNVRLLLYAGTAVNRTYYVTYTNMCIVKGSVPLQYVPSIKDINSGNI